MKNDPKTEIQRMFRANNYYMIWRLSFLFLCPLLTLYSCGSVKPRATFDPAQVPSAADYALLENWAAHPDKSDPADLSPNADKAPDLQKDATIDVFFLHPTTYTGDLRHQRDWNASMTDERTNRKTDNGSIQYQASIFNGAGRVFAPRYRQAHLHAFFTKKDSVSARRSLEVAYADTKTAFQYYLKHWNYGRPFILAGHSQGGLHVKTLVQQMVEGTDLEQQLVAAYIVGWPVAAKDFKKLKPCEKPDQVDCYCTWRTWERRFGKRLKQDQKTVCTNPLSWSTTPEVYVPKTQNKGAVIRPFNRIYEQSTDAEVYKGILLASKPKFKGSALFFAKNYHPGDFNLYYMNVRENA
ncbi:MAG: DUF3089 domain-containing protein, partial [Saprospiraceae bacterium]|nr:DUF3089 domain-containing protein [Saprospiraceae bacterium]